MQDLTSIIEFLADTISRFVRVLSFSFLGQIVLGAFMFSLLFTLVFSFLKSSSKK